MKFKPPPKRKKLDSAPSSSPSYYTHGVVPAEKREVNLTHAVEIQPSNVDLKIQQAKCFAVAQAQQDCCTGNFKIFDSPFGNYLVPVIPTRAELGG
ncbi:hypothetical protein MIMGU_mgv1a016938mg [Erythranthe guttata]|uniref:Uncharacterized protein n=1 Tax=Erythranthe guttata TaxID=4155 RepID=A0A022QVZ6_ERYGU|nr:hypothetical protein MIMGU_mgv1a016938mg [Erythranthe guttata]